MKTVNGIELLQMIKDGKIKDKTLIRYAIGVTIINEMASTEEYEYYIFSERDGKFHRCDIDGKLGAIGQEKFMNYSTLYKYFEILEKEENPKEIEELETTTENILFTMECYTGIPEKAQDWNFNILKKQCNELTKAVNYLLRKSDKDEK